MIILISIKKAIIKYHQLLVLKRCKPKNFYGNNNNKMNHKKQISMSKIPNSLPENKILNNKMTKKIK